MKEVAVLCIESIRGRGLNLRRSQSHEPERTTLPKQSAPCTATDAFKQAPWAAVPPRVPSPLVEPELLVPASRVHELLAALHLDSTRGAQSKTLEDLRRAIVSSQPPGGWGALWVYGALGRWLAQAGSGPLPKTWHLALLVRGPHGQKSPKHLPIVDQALAAVQQRLSKRGFAVRRELPAAAHTLRVDLGPGAATHALITVSPLHAPELQPVAACEQLVYDTGTKAWGSLPGVTLTQAQDLMVKGFWREPDGTADVPLTQEAAWQQLLTSWRHQAAGYSPTDAPDWQDGCAGAMVLEQQQATGSPSRATLISWAQQLLAPEVCPPHSPARQAQQAVTAVALTQLSLCWAGLADSGCSHPLRTAMQRVLRALVPEDDAAAQAALQVALAVADAPVRTRLLRLFVQHLPPTSAAFTVRRIEGWHAPMLRLGVEAFQTHLYLPVFDPSDGPLTLAIEPAPQPHHRAALLPQQSLGASIAQLLECPGLQHLIDGATARAPHTRPQWARALAQLAAAQYDEVPQSTTSQLLLAAAHLHPATFAQMHVEDRAVLPFATVADVVLHAPTAGPWQATLAALTHIWEAPEQVDEAWYEGSDERAIELIVALLTHTRAAPALGLLQLRPALCGLMPPDALVTLAAAALKTEHEVTAWLLEAILDQPAAVEALRDQPALLLRACAQPALAEVCGTLLAVLGTPDEHALAAWMRAARQAGRSDLLAHYLSAIGPEHAAYRPVTLALTAALNRTPAAPGAKEVGVAWRQLIEQARARKEQVQPDLVLMLQLHLHLRDHGQSGLLHESEEDNALMLELALHVLHQAETDEQLVSGAHSAHLVSQLMTDRGGDVLVEMLQRVSADGIIWALGEDWAANIALMLQQPVQGVTALSGPAAETLAALALEALTDGTSELQAACALAAHSAAALARAGYPGHAYKLLSTAAFDSRRMHVLSEELSAMPLPDALVDAWLEVFRRAAFRAPLPSAEEQVSPERLNSSIFWTHFITETAQRRMAGADAAGPMRQQAEADMRRVLDLVRLRGECCPLHVEETLLRALTRMASLHEYGRAAVLYLITRSSAPLGGRPPGQGYTSPIATPIWRAIIRSLPPAERRGENLLGLFALATDVRLTRTEDLLQAVLSDSAFAAAAQWAEFFLMDVADDRRAYLRMMRFFVSPSVHQTQAPQYLHELQSAAHQATGATQEATYALAVDAVVQQAGRRQQMSVPERMRHDHALFKVAHAVCYMPRTVTEVAQANLIAHIIGAVRIDLLGDRDIWQLFVEQTSPLLQALADRGATALAAFSRHMAEDELEATDGSHLDRCAEMLVDGHFELFNTRVQEPCSGSRDDVFEDLLQAHVMVGPGDYPVMLRDYLPTLARLCRETSFNKQLTAAMLERDLQEESARRMPAAFHNWLFEGLRLGAPLTVAHLALAQTLDSERTEQNDKDLVMRRMRQLLQLSDSAMVREASALAQRFKQMRAHLRAHPGDAAACLARAQAWLDEAWGPMWPPQVPERVRRSTV